MKIFVGISAYLIVVAITVSAAYHWLEARRVATSRAEQLFARADWAAAVPLYKQAIGGQALSVDNRQLHERLAKCYLNSGDPQQAWAICQLLLTTQLLNHELLLAVVDQLWQQQQRQSALDALALALSNAATEHAAALHLKYARMLAWDNRLAEAVAHYRIILGDSLCLESDNVIAQP